MISLNPAESRVMAQHWGGLHATTALFHYWLVSRRARACQHAGRPAGWDCSICHRLAWGCFECGTACWVTYFFQWKNMDVLLCVCVCVSMFVLGQQRLGHRASDILHIYCTVLLSIFTPDYFISCCLTLLLYYSSERRCFFLLHYMFWQLLITTVYIENTVYCYTLNHPAVC